MAAKWTVRKIKAPKHDFDVKVEFAPGVVLLIQARPSNASEGYNGSLDIILPKDQVVMCWAGDHMDPAPKAQRRGSHVRAAKQLCIELPPTCEEKL